jgi:hypothetical protein
VENNYDRYYDVLMKVHPSLLDSEVFVWNVITNMLSDVTFFNRLHGHLKTALYFSVQNISHLLEGTIFYRH